MVTSHCFGIAYSFITKFPIFKFFITLHAYWRLKTFFMLFALSELFLYTKTADFIFCLDVFTSAMKY